MIPPDEPADTQSKDDQLAMLLERWEEATSEGRSATIDDVCSDRPELAPAFRRLLENLGVVNAVMQGEGMGETSPGDLLEPVEADRYQPLSFYAHGGLGVIFIAEDTELHRNVALKCMRALPALDAEARRRFLVEAEITGKLEHPGIVPIYGLGTDARHRPYYAMRFINGTTLGDSITAYHDRRVQRDPQGNVEFRKLLRCFVTVCETMAYAHSRGVLHRDLKPANIMLGPFGETLVVDWGLAKRIGVAEPIELAPENAGPGSIAGIIKGSPPYMSPEQARGESEAQVPTSDVYSLGSILYEILTGQRAYTGQSVQEILAKVSEGRFLPPSYLMRDVPKALEAVCLKAMRFLPEDRYNTARDLAADLERWLADEPVTAWREPLTHRARRWFKRHRTLVTTAVAGLTISSLLLAVLGARLSQKNRELDQRHGQLVDLHRKEHDARERAEKHLRRNIGQLEAMLRFALASKTMEAARRDPVYLALLDHLRGQLADFARDVPDDDQSRRVIGLTAYLRAVADPGMGLTQDSLQLLTNARDEFSAILSRNHEDSFAIWGLAAVRIEEARRAMEAGQDDRALATALDAGNELIRRVSDDQPGPLQSMALAGCCELLAELWERSRKPETASLVEKIDVALRWLNAQPRQLQPESLARVMSETALNPDAIGLDPYWRTYLTAVLQYRRGQALHQGLHQSAQAIETWNAALRSLELTSPNPELLILSARVRFDLGLAHRLQLRHDQAWRYFTSARDALPSGLLIASEQRSVRDLQGRIHQALILAGIDYLEMLRPENLADRSLAVDVLDETRDALDRWSKESSVRLTGQERKARQEQIDQWQKKLEVLAKKFGKG